MSYKENEPRLSKSVTDKISEYLFHKPSKEQNGGKDDESKFLDTRTDIPNKAFMNSLFYYRLLERAYACPEAGEIADSLELLAISMGRQGRLEGVNIMKGPQPKKEYVLHGTMENLEELEETK